MARSPPTACWPADSPNVKLALFSFVIKIWDHNGAVKEHSAGTAEEGEQGVAALAAPAENVSTLRV